MIDDCAYFEQLFNYSLEIAGSSLTAAKYLLNDYRMVINWNGGRHHAKQDQASGFCYVNDVVLAIDTLSNKYKRILYIDIDIHHGDGVESSYIYSQRVCTLSFHQYELGLNSINTVSFQEVVLLITLV